MTTPTPPRRAVPRGSPARPAVGGEGAPWLPSPLPDPPPAPEAVGSRAPLSTAAAGVAPGDTIAVFDRVGDRIVSFHTDVVLVRTDSLDVPSVEVYRVEVGSPCRLPPGVAMPPFVRAARRMAVSLAATTLAAGCGPAGESSGATAAGEDAGPLVFDHYHTLAEIDAYLEAAAARHPELVTLHEIGRSRAGRAIRAVDLNDPSTGPAAEKPGFYVDGNIHGGEVLGGEGALAFLDRLLGGYGKDERITELVRTRAFYVVPIVNPDGRAISVDTPENHRWNVRPTDEDGDGLTDEDPPEDLDGDGRILRMRIPDPEGEWTLHPADPRRMVRAPAGAPRAARYRLESEGTDDDGDGRFNEDRVGGVDLNRNFPANWSAAQYASGPFPLSEPETWALARYVTERPNIAAVHTFHTSGGLILRFPTLADQDWDFPAADLEAYRRIAEEGVRLTGYRNMAYEKKEIVDLMRPGHGVFNDWASKEFGVLAITTEMWAHAIGEGEEALFRWNDEVLGGAGFIDWHPFDHPQLGGVELGGWDRWSTASPPEPMIAKEVERNVDWVMTWVEKTPRVAVLSATAEPATGGAAGEVRIEAVVANVGWMATATEHAVRTLRAAVPVRVRIELEGAELAGGEAVMDLGVLPGTMGGEPVERNVAWTVRVDGAGPARATVVVTSEKAGTARRGVEVGGGG